MEAIVREMEKEGAMELNTNTQKTKFMKVEINKQ